MAWTVSVDVVSTANADPFVADEVFDTLEAARLFANKILESGANHLMRRYNGGVWETVAGGNYRHGSKNINKITLIEV